MIVLIIFLAISLPLYGLALYAFFKSIEDTQFDG